MQVATLDNKLSQVLPTEISQKSRKLEQLEREAAEPQRSREVGRSDSFVSGEQANASSYERLGWWLSFGSCMGPLPLSFAHSLVREEGQVSSCWTYIPFDPPAVLFEVHGTLWSV